MAISRRRRISSARVPHVTSLTKPEVAGPRGWSSLAGGTRFLPQLSEKRTLLHNYTGSQFKADSRGKSSDCSLIISNRTVEDSNLLDTDLQINSAFHEPHCNGLSKN